MSEHDESWEFCGVSGIIGEELEFIYEYKSSKTLAVCTPVSKTSETELCYSNVATTEHGTVEESLFGADEEVEVLSTESQINYMLNYFLIGTLICFLLALMTNQNDKSDFEILPTESERSTQKKNKLMTILNGNSRNV